VVTFNLRQFAPFDSDSHTIVFPSILTIPNSESPSKDRNWYLGSNDKDEMIEDFPDEGLDTVVISEYGRAGRKF
jgi:hypothetical protein